MTPTLADFADLARIVERQGLAAVVSEAETGQCISVPFWTREWRALMDWLKMHDLDPFWIPGGKLIVRDGPGRCIRYEGIVADAHGKPTLKRDPDGDLAPNCDGEWVRPLLRTPSGALKLETLPMVQQGEAIAPLPEVIARWLR